MQGVVLAAGKNTRGDGAYKPSVLVGGWKALDWQRPHLPEQTTVVGPGQSSVYTCRNYDYFGFDGGGGPVRALHAVLPSLVDDSVLVAYADTLWFSAVPSVPGWFGVSSAKGGRVWDISDEYGHCGRFDIPAGQTVDVCVGLYAFEDPEKLLWACEEAIETCPDPEVHMYRVVNLMGLWPHRVDWVDVGDPAALKRAEDRLRGKRP